MFETLARELHFPEYFGYNWDALSECLRDLSWTNHRRVAIVHDDVPELGKGHVAIYLSVLANAVRDWKPDEAHELLVVFPKHYRESLARLIV